MSTFTRHAQTLARRRHRLAALRLSLPWAVSVLLGFALGWISCLLFIGRAGR